MSDGDAPAAQEKHWEDLYQNAPCGYLTTGTDGTIVEVNDTFLAWTGHHREALVGRTRFFELLSPGDRIYYETHYAPLLRMQGFVREIAVTMVCPDGRRLPVLVNAVLRTSGEAGEHQIRSAVFLAEDRRAYERELLEARRRAERSENHARVLAQTLQASLLPPELPDIPGVQLAAVYRPAGSGDEVGGDFYDLFETRRDDWVVVLGDVSGKGASAAVLTSLVRHTARAAAIRARRPRTLLTALNESLLRERSRTKTLRISTVVCARLQTGGRDGVRLTVGLAGHPYPFLLRAREQPIAVGRPGTLLGVLPNPSLHEVSMVLSPGDAVVLYTDGVTEARRGGEFFGEARLEALLATLEGQDAAGIATRISDEVLGFQGGYASDDIAVVVIRVPELEIGH
jgi:sigma-B regulation protein RsbU (phosphoserine phosphatase)